MSADINTLPGQDVHLWWIELDIIDTDIEALKSDLTPDEIERAENYAFLRNQYQFVIARAGMRRILARYLGGKPKQVVFRYGQRGKPFVEDDCDLQFNLSHSKEWAVLAVTQGASIGVDIEYHDPRRDCEGLVQRYFSLNERLAYSELPQDEKRAGFYRIWTSKEAFIKAIGEGLFSALDTFDVSVDLSEAASLLEVRHPDFDIAHWAMTSFPTKGEYSFAMVREGFFVDIHQRTLLLPKT